MNNQERAEVAFEYFIKFGEVTIGDISEGGDVLTCVDVARILWLDDKHPGLSFNEYGVAYMSRASKEIHALIDKHYEY